ncbi:MAG: alpha/beta hydrolase-fold protein [Alphaproteobacteria bacterium]
MHHPDFKGTPGRVQSFWIASDAVAGNLLGESARRRVDVWRPTGVETEGLPLLVDLAAWGSGGPAHSNWEGMRENLPERLDRLYADGQLPACVVAMPDCYLRMGGNQYTNSPVTGNWMDFLADEMAPHLEQHFGCGGPGKRGLFGKSSGGSGAFINAALRPDIWSGFACLSGDMGFDLMFGHELARAATVLAGKHDGSIQTFVTALRENPSPGWDQLGIMMVLAQSAFYDPDPDAFMGLSLPVRLSDASLIEDKWANWKRFDPVEMVEPHASALSGLKAIWVECGTLDEHFLHYGCRSLSQRLTEHGIAHEHHEFTGGHRGLDYRLDESLPWLAHKLNDA